MASFSLSPVAPGASESGGSRRNRPRLGSPSSPGGAFPLQAAPVKKEGDQKGIFLGVVPKNRGLGLAFGSLTPCRGDSQVETNYKCMGQNQRPEPKLRAPIARQSCYHSIHKNAVRSSPVLPFAPFLRSLSSRTPKLCSSAVPHLCLCRACLALTLRTREVHHVQLPHLRMSRA